MEGRPGRGPAGWLGGDPRIEGEEEQAGERALNRPRGRGSWCLGQSRGAGPGCPARLCFPAAWAAGSGRSLGAWEFVLLSVTWAAPTSWGFATAE